MANQFFAVIINKHCIYNLISTLHNAKVPRHMRHATKGKTGNGGKKPPSKKTKPPKSSKAPKAPKAKAKAKGKKAKRATPNAEALATDQPVPRRKRSKSTA